MVVISVVAVVTAVVVAAVVYSCCGRRSCRSDCSRETSCCGRQGCHGCHGHQSRPDSIKQISSSRFRRADSIEQIRSTRFRCVYSMDQIPSCIFHRADTIVPIPLCKFHRADFIVQILSVHSIVQIPLQISSCVRVPLCATHYAFHYIGYIVYAFYRVFHRV